MAEYWPLLQAAVSLRSIMKLCNIFTYALEALTVSCFVSRWSLPSIRSGEEFKLISREHSCPEYKKDYDCRRMEILVIPVLIFCAQLVWITICSLNTRI